MKIVFWYCYINLLPICDKSYQQTEKNVGMCVGDYE